MNPKQQSTDSTEAVNEVVLDQPSLATDSPDIGEQAHNGVDMTSACEPSVLLDAEPAPQTELAKEVNGPKGLEPTRYGDWESKGRCYDF